MLWNVFLKPYPDGEHDFGTLESALFDAMIRSQCESGEPMRSSDGREYYRELRVIPGLPEFDVLVGSEEDDAWRWKTGRWTFDGVILNYVRFIRL